MTEGKAAGGRDQPQRPDPVTCPPWCAQSHDGDSTVLVHSSVNYAAEPSGRYVVTVGQRETLFRGRTHRDYAHAYFSLGGNVQLVMDAAQARMLADAVDAMPAMRFLSDGLRRASETLEQHTPGSGKTLPGPPPTVHNVNYVRCCRLVRAGGVRASRSVVASGLGHLISSGLGWLLRSPGWR